MTEANIYWKNGEFHSDLVCTDPVQNFPKGAKESAEKVLRASSLICKPILGQAKGVASLAALRQQLSHRLWCV